MTEWNTVYGMQLWLLAHDGGTAVSAELLECEKKLCKPFKAQSKGDFFPS